MTQKQKGYVGLGVMVVLAGVTVFASTPIYDAIDTMAAKSISYTPGSYTGSAEGFGGKVTATVTVSDKGIDSVVLAGNDETPELGGVALEKLTPLFVEAQSSQVDAISGSTITSVAAMGAVQNALDQASGKIDVVPVEETEAPKETEAETEAETTAKVEETRTFQAGTYTGTAKGYGGDVTATVVITESGIESVELVGNDETEELGGVALEKLSKKFVEAQTSTVDAVSGCTVTSNAAMEAVEQALAQAASGEAAPAGAEAAEPVSYAPGTYTGSAEGYAGEVSATVVVGDAGIESVELVGNEETEELGGAALKKLSKKMVEAQSPKVDAVTGSTVTSDAAIAAVSQALEQAITDTAEPEPEAVEVAEGGSFKAGTYTGTARGYGGKVTATVVITDSGIESVELVGSDETEALGGVALEKLSKKFVEAQSSEVDAISGSTVTSDAAIEAVKQALDQAK